MDGKSQTTIYSEREQVLSDALDDALLYGAGFVMVHSNGRYERLPTKAVTLDMAMIAAAREAADGKS